MRRPQPTLRNRTLGVYGAQERGLFFVRVEGAERRKNVQVDGVGRDPGAQANRPGGLHLFVGLALLGFLGFLFFLGCVVCREGDGAEDEAEADCECEELFHGGFPLEV